VKHTIIVEVPEWMTNSAAATHLSRAIESTPVARDNGRVFPFQVVEHLLGPED
jgi:hypothetical protein